jgi:hypothetical protein
MPLVSCWRKVSIYRRRKYWRNWSCSVTTCAMTSAILKFARSLTTPTRNRLRMPLSGQTISRFKVIACAQIRPDRLIVDIRCSESKPFVRHSRASAAASIGWSGYFEQISNVPGCVRHRTVGHVCSHLKITVPVIIEQRHVRCRAILRRGVTG